VKKIRRILSFLSAGLSISTLIPPRGGRLGALLWLPRPVAEAWIFLIFAVVWLSGASALAQEPPQIEGCQVFPANNIWNTPITHLPLDPNSDAYINSIGADVHLHPDVGRE